MAGIIPPFETNSVQLTRTISLMLPDPNSFDPAHVIARPLIARYANTTLLLTRVETSAATTLACPVIGTLRKIALDNTVAGNAALITEGIETLLEISPLPFFIAPILRAIPGGVPVFYFGSPTLNPDLFDEDATISQTQQLDSGTLFYFGVVFQDRVCLETWSWAAIIERAIIAAGEDASPWTSFINALFPVNASRIIKVLDHVGRMHLPTSFNLTVNGQQRIVNSNADGVLDLSATSGADIELQWLGNANPGELVSHPVMAMYETGESSNPDTAMTLPSTFERGHLQLFELANWFTKPNSDSSMKRFHTNSRVEPLVDGHKVFRLIADDMIHCAPDTPYADGEESNSGAHFMGWGFKEFVLDSRLLDADQKPYTYATLTQHLIDRNCDVHALVNKLFSVENMDDAARRNAILMTVMITDIVLVASVLGAVDTNAPGMTILMGGQLLSPLGVLLLDDLNTFIEEKMDQSPVMFPKFNEIKPNLAIRSVYPSLHEDNPLAETITIPLPEPMVLTNFVLGAGTWHQKVQLFKRAAGKLDDRGNQFIAYLGGMDMNGNRIDNFGRQGNSPYHDVHSRVTGPGASDVFKSWDERYVYEIPLTPGADPVEKIFDVPLPENLTLTENPKHILQISRTLFKPENPNSTHKFEYAKQGDNSINQNIIRGIREAREYIYIEDQYFIPNETTLGLAYLDALLEAADHCERLIVVGLSVMALADVPFGHERRADISSRLLSRWGNRALIGAPLRRPILPSPGRITHEGRCIVYEDITTLSETIKIGPRARLPKSLPFWLWINGELMLVVELTDNNEVIDTHPVVTLKVLRGNIGSNGGWGATMREHAKGSPATASQLRGIFVHAKTMMVDDIFVSIGSANINRRGLFSDGEINVFAIPEQLKASPENPAKILRTELWAEQLGLPPSMGASLLQDPIAAFELFRRNFYGGNRFVPFSLFDFNDDPELKFSISTNLLANALMNFGMGWFVTHREQLFNTLSDPTTIDDPQPTPGP